MYGAAREVEQVALLELELHQRLAALVLVEIPAVLARELVRSRGRVELPLLLALELKDEHLDIVVVRRCGA